MIKNITLLSLCCALIFISGYANANTTCNNFTLTVQNDTSDDIRVHYIVPGDGLPPEVKSPSNRNIPGDVDVKKGETKEIVTVVNPSKSVSQALYEGKTDSLHDDTWVRVQVFAKNTDSKEELKFDRVIKKPVGKWKFSPTLLQWHREAPGGLCVRDFVKDVQVYKVVAVSIDFDRSFVTSEVIVKPYEGVLLSVPLIRDFGADLKEEDADKLKKDFAAYLQNRCIFAEGECGAAQSAADRTAQEPETPNEYVGVVTLQLTE